LFNLRSLEVENLEAVVICEGAADTITATLALEGCTFIAVVGVPGVNAWQRTWAQLFNGLRVVVAADNDTAGQTLEKLIRQDLDRAPDYYRPSSGDLTDTAKAIGLPALRELLLGRLATQPEAQEHTIDNQLGLLRQMFPGGFVVGEAS
jgi:DNA primase